MLINFDIDSDSDESFPHNNSPESSENENDSFTIDEVISPPAKKIKIKFSNSSFLQEKSHVIKNLFDSAATEDDELKNELIELKKECLNNSSHDSSISEDSEEEGESMPIIDEIKSPLKDINSQALKNNPLDKNKIKNNNLRQKSSFVFGQILDVQLTVCYVAKVFNFLKVLVKDSENFFSLLETQLETQLLIGSVLRITNLRILSKVTSDVSMTLFSILVLFGSQQRTYFRLTDTSDTLIETLESPPDDLFFTQNVGSISVQDLNQIPTEIDQRVIVVGLLKSIETKSNVYLLIDESTCSQFKITILSSFDISQLASINLKSRIKIVLLRITRGLAYIDEFTTLELC